MIKFALACQASGEQDKAAELYALAAKLAPDDVDIQNAYADFLFATGELRQSVAILQSLVRSNPSNFDAIMGLARIARRTGNPDKAIEFATRATEVRSNSSSAWQFLGIALMERRRLTKADAALRNAIRFDARNIAARLALGDLQLMQRKPKTARQTFEKLVRLAPQNIVALNKIAVIAAMQRQWAVAEGYLNDALVVAPEDQMTLANLGKVLHQQGKHAQALEAYHRAVQREVVSVPTAQQYAWLLASRKQATPGDVERALHWARYAIKTSGKPDAKLLDTLAVAQAAAGKFGDAVETAKNAVELAKKGDPRQALEMMSRRELFSQRKKYIEAGKGR